MLITHLHLVLRSRISRAIPLTHPICIHDMDRDKLNFYLLYVMDVMLYVYL